jgi:hypothetical protein
MKKRSGYTLASNTIFARCFRFGKYFENNGQRKRR